jgi:hypothetical protein
MPRGFFSALGFLPLGFEGREASSSRSRASFSAFLRAASAAFSAAASLPSVSYCICIDRGGNSAYAFAFDFAPLFHSSASAFSACWFFAACFDAAASALRACPCAFFEPSPPPAAPFFAIMLWFRGVCVWFRLGYTCSANIWTSCVVGSESNFGMRRLTAACGHQRGRWRQTTPTRVND